MKKFAFQNYLQRHRNVDGVWILVMCKNQAAIKLIPFAEKCGPFIVLIILALGVFLVYGDK